MSELSKLWEKHHKAIKDLRENCNHIPNLYSTPVRVEEGVWGEAVLCSICGEILRWTEEPTRQYEMVEIY